MPKGKAKKKAKSGTALWGKVGVVLPKRWRAGDRIEPRGGMRGVCAETCEPPDGRPYNLDPGPPLVPRACDAFTPEELDARIAALAAYHAERRPPPPTRPRCDCCGLAGKPGDWMKLNGWRRRKIDAFRRVDEVYCPDCFAEHGWGGEGGGL
jgi:hypothetical protein